MQPSAQLSRVRQLDSTELDTVFHNLLRSWTMSSLSLFKVGCALGESGCGGGSKRRDGADFGI